MYWYQRRTGQGPRMIASFLLGSATYEDGFKSGYEVWSSQEKKWSLKVQSLRNGDSAEYLCAASPHSLTNGVKFEQTPVQTVQPGQQVDIECSHDDSSLLIMYWYEQKDSRALHLIGFGYSTGEPTYEPQHCLTQLGSLRFPMMLCDNPANRLL
ncbi:hypothetical protein JZ751_003131 [Albula glossodonta]|uniref:Ig-like domain-containing protein n=1 Tax=Albula glossodonta TaxID=121402 RepID=A0A8T2N8Q6_9TELE|nr:hypothetical protein JZ751_003131 [Albula glossodonta]